MKRIITTLSALLFACWIFAFLGFAQISTDEAPISFTNQAINLTLNKQEIDMKVLPRLDMIRIQEEDEKYEQNGLPHKNGDSAALLSRNRPGHRLTLKVK